MGNTSEKHQQPKCPLLSDDEHHIIEDLFKTISNNADQLKETDLMVMQNYKYVNPEVIQFSATTEILGMPNRPQTDRVQQQLFVWTTPTEIDDNGSTTVHRIVCIFYSWHN
jgi:hypothetical protein